MSSEASKFECISTPWVRLFSRYTVLIIHFSVSKLSVSMILPPMFSHVIDFSFPANDSDLLISDSYELSLPESPLHLEIRDKHLRGSLLRVERFGVSIQYISGVTFSKEAFLLLQNR